MLLDLLSHDTYDAVPSTVGVVVALVGEVAEVPHVTVAGLVAVLGVQLIRVSPRLLAVLMGGKRRDARLAVVLAENAALRREREQRAERDAVREILTGTPVAPTESPR
jgi:hypothetical protein